MTSLLRKLYTTRILIDSFKRANLTPIRTMCQIQNSTEGIIDSKNDPNAPEWNMSNPFEKEKSQCILCRLNITPDYKNVKLLSQFQSPYTGRIYGRHITGLCEHKQKQVELEIQKAQNACLMGYYNKDPVFIKDPKLFDSENPIRPHRF